MNGRSIGAVIGGIVVGLFVTFLFGFVIDKLYPPDIEAFKKLNGNPAKIKEYLRNLPSGFHLMGVIGGFLRLLVGLFVGSLIDKQNLMTPIVISAFFILLAVLDSFAFPHPMWYGLVYIPVIIVASIGYIYLRRKA